MNFQQNSPQTFLAGYRDILLPPTFQIVDQSSMFEREMKFSALRK